MSKILTLVCAHERHDECVSSRCECDCHKDFETLQDELRQRRLHRRELAHHTVKLFDHNPDLANTQAAILALQQYETTLKETPHGR